MFVTALAGCLDLATGRLRLANAGHNLPYLLHDAGGADRVSATNAVALGITEDATFPITELALQPGDGLFVYTDGVCDAVDKDHRAFGTAAIEARLADLASRPAEEIVHAMFDTIDAFASGAPQEDDITVAVVRYRGRAVAR
jgi:sigma-B regulation protein RsbU (phosphoserine phosphatase)